MPTMRWHRIAVGVALALSLSGWASASPLDLGNPTPRWIEVRFEVSPADEPGSTDRAWSPYRRAWLSPAAGDSALEIRVPPEEVEDQLRSTGTDPVEGSFSAFVWRLDRHTGHVLDAGLTGRVREQVQLGPFRRTTEVAIDVAMTTFARAGYVSSSGALGIETHAYCQPSTRRARCTEVPAVPFDRARGYVNAVGMVRASAGLIEVRAFSPLGEVEFRERSTVPGESVVSGAPMGDGVCSAASRGLCPADLGEES